jgi:sugar/nucleoside kinase (ribokinase family)
MVDVACGQLPPAGARIHADVTMRAGGSAFNAARAATSAGARVTVVGRIGGDPAGDLVLAEVSAAGIAAHLASDAELPTGTAVAFPGPTVVATRGANSRFAVNDVPDAIDADALFVSGFALFQSGSADAAALAIERFTGRWIGIDVASPTLAVIARDTEIISAGRETVIFATAEEARAMTSAKPEEAAHELASRFSVACVTLGEEGALAVSGGNLERRRGDRVTRRSLFGAGDAFAGTFLVALATGSPLGRALELACGAGAEAAARSHKPNIR